MIIIFPWPNMSFLSSSVCEHGQWKVIQKECVPSPFSYLVTYQMTNSDLRLVKCYNTHKARLTRGSLMHMVISDTFYETHHITVNTNFIWHLFLTIREIWQFLYFIKTVRNMTLALATLVNRTRTVKGTDALSLSHSVYVCEWVWVRGKITFALKSSSILRQFHDWQHYYVQVHSMSV